MPPIILWVNGLVDNDIAKTAIWSSVVFHGVRLVMYYYHERLWLKVKWGQRPASSACVSL